VKAYEQPQEDMLLCRLVDQSSSVVANLVVCAAQLLLWKIIRKKSAANSI
jgi:hypothetical protein